MGEKRIRERKTNISTVLHHYTRITSVIVPYIEGLLVVYPPDSSHLFD